MSCGLVSAVLTLSRNLGLVTGAAVMGAVFAYASGGATTTAEDVAAGTHATFAAAAGLVAVGLVVALAGQALACRRALASR